jgi:hypothetical protein
MRYITDILQRYQAGWGFVAGAAAANIEGFINRGAFAAGIAYNDSRYAKRNNDRDFKGLELYPVDDWSFSDIKIVYRDRSLKFGFCSLTEPDDSFFAPPPMISFRRSKNISVTVIDDGDESEIVENFGTNSWDIEIRGLLVDMVNHWYPQAKLQEFARFFEINDILEVYSAMFSDLGIHSIWLKEQSIEPVEAFPDTIRFSLEARSIRPAEFSILNGI